MSQDWHAPVTDVLTTVPSGKCCIKRQADKAQFVLLVILGCVFKFIILHDKYKLVEHFPMYKLIWTCWVFHILYME